MVGVPPETTAQLLAELAALQQATAPDQPGTVVDDIIAVAGGITTAGGTFNPGLASNWIAVGTGTQAFSAGLTGLVAEIDRAPVHATTELAGFYTACWANLGPAQAWGFWTEVGLWYNGTASLGSGLLLAYVTLARPYPKTGSKRTVVQWTPS